MGGLSSIGQSRTGSCPARSDNDIASAWAPVRDTRLAMLQATHRDIGQHCHDKRDGHHRQNALPPSLACQNDPVRAAWFNGCALLVVTDQQLGCSRVERR
jgi:hypothetical protein